MLLDRSRWLACACHQVCCLQAEKAPGVHTANSSVRDSCCARDLPSTATTSHTLGMQTQLTHDAIDGCAQLMAHDRQEAVLVVHGFFEVLQCGTSSPCTCMGIRCRPATSASSDNCAVQAGRQPMYLAPEPGAARPATFASAPLLGAIWRQASDLCLACQALCVWPLASDRMAAQEPQHSASPVPGSSQPNSMSGRRDLSMCPN